MCTDLEKNYGGEHRALRYICQQLFESKRLDKNNKVSCIEIHARLVKFVQHCEQNGLASSLSSIDTVQKVYVKLLSEDITKEIKALHNQRLLHKDIDSVQVVVEWLEKVIETWEHVDNMFPSSKPALYTPRSAPARFTPRGRTGKTFLTTEDPNEDSSYESPSAALGVESHETGSVSCEDEDDEELDYLVMDMDDFEPARYTFMTSKGFKPRNCGFCLDVKKVKAAHPIYLCDAFKAAEFNDKSRWIRDSKRCRNCLSAKHLSAECLSKHRCSKCEKAHHTLLHRVD